ncbi:L-histidine N(alpha)-methyltransferase [Maribacter sp. PR1]|uniref:L-histidine N(Alpha)-methyltransferase n=1 Tax=Maribacter cobaltidurans TaxID=1178778 RepID=A0ABU7IYL5_9FLAO|nr:MULTISPECIES: L-histidine N(alpha)-methyltransferase [Maribacter]MDC6390692.1 L-histidine N(alpha)-methyltransferase [Maribacter sp. PR1]MEE1978084.1 L-histidine N(alpha)-methyltransferase [Maribacter cobaltidurans]
MQQPPKTIKLTDFEQEVCEGLNDFPKHLSSKYFYDEIGDVLFQKIMAMPTYYLTQSEYDILNNHKKEIAAMFKSNGDFDLIELGAGDGKKTKVLLQELCEQNCEFTYIPIDISKNSLKKLTASVTSELPKVKIDGFQGTYFEALKELDSRNHKRKVILFLGSNIGNLKHDQAIHFLSEIRQLMQPNDILFIGVDQKKNPQSILDAYNDKEGITSQFNKNILNRINKELQADFDLNKFMHWENYDPENGTAKSYLVSKVEQKVFLRKLDVSIHFKAWETIHTEISQKYDDDMVNWLGKEAGLKIQESFQNHSKAFKDYVFTI